MWYFCSRLPISAVKMLYVKVFLELQYFLNDNRVQKLRKTPYER